MRDNLVNNSSLFLVPKSSHRYCNFYLILKKLFNSLFSICQYYSPSIRHCKSENSSVTLVVLLPKWPVGHLVWNRDLCHACTLSAQVCLKRSIILTRHSDSPGQQCIGERFYRIDIIDSHILQMIQEAKRVGCLYKPGF